MSKHHKQKNPPYGKSKKARRRQEARWLISITGVLVILLAGWVWFESGGEDRDLAAIGQGENVVVQVHDPG